MHPAFSFFGDDDLAVERPGVLAAGPDTVSLPAVTLGTYVIGAAVGALGVFAVLGVARIAREETPGAAHEKGLAAAAALLGGGAILGVIATNVGVGAQRKALVTP
jgi:hypothetical protein